MSILSRLFEPMTIIAMISAACAALWLLAAWFIGVWIMLGITVGLGALWAFVGWRINKAKERP